MEEQIKQLVENICNDLTVNTVFEFKDKRYNALIISNDIAIKNVSYDDTGYDETSLYIDTEIDVSIYLDEYAKESNFLGYFSTAFSEDLVEDDGTVIIFDYLEIMLNDEHLVHYTKDMKLSYQLIYTLSIDDDMCIAELNKELSNAKNITVIKQSAYLSQSLYELIDDFYENGYYGDFDINPYAELDYPYYEDHLPSTPSSETIIEKYTNARTINYIDTFEINDIANSVINDITPAKKNIALI